MRDDSQTGPSAPLPAEEQHEAAGDSLISSATRVGELGEAERLIEPAIERPEGAPPPPQGEESDLITQLAPEPAGQPPDALSVSTIASQDSVPTGDGEEASLATAEGPPRPMSLTALGSLEGSDEAEALLHPPQDEPGFDPPSSETELEPLSSEPAPADGEDDDLEASPQDETGEVETPAPEALEDSETGDVPLPEPPERGDTGPVSAPEAEATTSRPELTDEEVALPKLAESSAPLPEASAPEEESAAAQGLEPEQTEASDQPSTPPRADSLPRLPTSTQPLLEDGDAVRAVEPLTGVTSGVPLKPGEELANGRYQVKSLWHQGLQLRTYRARGPMGSVAIYELCDPTGRPDLVRVVRRLAERPPALKHPNLISIIEVAEDPERGPLVVVEAPQGGTLRQLLEHRGTPLSAPTAAVVMRPLAEAVAHLHRHGVFIRAVTPDNLLFTPEGKPKLNAVFEALGEAFSTERVDTLYLAPEGRAGGPPSVAGDVWSLGACLQFSFLGPDRWRRSPAQIPVAMAPIIARATDHRPAQRYASASALAAALKRVAQPGAASLWENPMVFGGGIAALVAVLVLVVAMLPPSRPEVSKAPVVAKFQAAPVDPVEDPNKAAVVPRATAPASQPAPPPPVDAAPQAAAPAAKEAEPPAAKEAEPPPPVPTSEEAPKINTAADDEPSAPSGAIPSPSLTPPASGPSAAELSRAKRLRRSGDRAARKRRWLRAALAYRRSLAINPKSGRASRGLRKVEAKTAFIEARNRLRRTLARAKSLDDEGARAAFQSLEVLTPDSAVVQYWKSQAEGQ